MSRSLPLVHAPVPNPFLRFAGVVTGGAASSAEIVGALADWTGVQVFASPPSDWPGDDPTLGGVPVGQTAVRAQGLYQGVDPNFTITPRFLGNGKTLVWRAIWLFDPSASPLSSQCPAPICPPCAPCPSSPGSSSSSSSFGSFLLGGALGAALGGAGVILARRGKR